MTKLTKRMRVMFDKIDVTKQYDLTEAILLLKEITVTNFIESVDVAINLGIDPRKADQIIRGTVVLPHGTGRNILVAVFAHGIQAEEAKAAGADLVGMEDLADEIKKKKFNFDLLLATPNTMHIVYQLGQLLGPRGLMPNPKFGTVNSNIAEAVKNAKSGQIHYRSEKNGIIHAAIGKINFPPNRLKENLETFLSTLKKSKPIQFKGSFIQKITLSTTMSVGLVISQNSLSATIT
ncbi:50S ribosomal protein L1 [Sodalis sp. CWE]|uniref:50S ribosomal protein L1 n=1 Tax=Sodalis sp. CWE TaxID=2803816 RepID=UPI001C7D1D5E|nr:50S ribosomal protein L1 [Sodalis sp. CWE]MBX4181110.1 50S ribosomal protein L1 [Sodalis sp. CWE]